MKKSVLILIIIMIISVSYAESIVPKSILIINSYNESYNWTNDIMNGILDNLDQTLDIRVEYMDAKNRYTKEDIEVFSSFMTYKYSAHEFDAIITTDDYAFQYALGQQYLLFDKTPIFFTGVNSKEGYDFDTLENVYGIFEKASIQETIDVAQKLNPNLREIHLIIDQSISGEKTQLEVKQVLEAHFNVVTYDGLTLDEITTSLASIDSKEAIVLLAYYIVDPSGIFHDTNVMTKKISEAANIPVFGLYDFSMHHGIVGGKLISGYEQGKRITTIMSNYFTGIYHNQYIETNESNIHKYDYEELKVYDFDVLKLPKGSIVFNQPETFFNKNKEVLLGSMIIVVVLLVYIILLRKQVSFHTKRNIIYHKQLNESDKLASLGEMIFRISHELNTPLGNSITNATYIEKLNTDLLDHYNNGKLSKTMLIEKLSQIKHSSGLLNTSLNTANELMTAFRVFSEHNANDKEIVFDLNYYLKNLIRTFNPLLANHNNRILLHVDENLFIVGQTKNYYKIFNHLIRNSIEHGFENLEYKEICIEVQQSKKELFIKYTDNGVGIDNKNADNIFKHLYSTKHGTHIGLGLSQVKQIISDMNGEMKFITTINEGVDIHIKLPLIKEQ